MPRSFVPGRSMRHCHHYTQGGPDTVVIVILPPLPFSSFHEQAQASSQQLIHPGSDRQKPFAAKDSVIGLGIRLIAVHEEGIINTGNPNPRIAKITHAFLNLQVNPINRLYFQVNFTTFLLRATRTLASFFRKVFFPSKPVQRKELQTTIRTN